MVVNGDNEIYPIDRRVAPAFCTDAQLKADSQNKYSRPLIETIISLRIKEDQNFNVQKQGTITFTIMEEINKIAGEILDLLEENSNFIGDVVQVTVDRISKARAQTGTDVSAKADNIAQ